MKKILLSALLLILIAVGYLLVQKKNAPVVETQTVVSLAVPEITRENVKAARKALIEQLANDLYAETDKELKNGEPVKYDDESIYDDIVRVEVEVIVPDFEPVVTADDISEDTLQ